MKVLSLVLRSFFCGPLTNSTITLLVIIAVVGGWWSSWYWVIPLLVFIAIDSYIDGARGALPRNRRQQKICDLMGG